MNTSGTELQLDDLDALIGELEVDFQQLREIEPDQAPATTNNSCCAHGSCYTF